jgi:hypothetical protein
MAALIARGVVNGFRDPFGRTLVTVVPFRSRRSRPEWDAAALRTLARWEVAAAPYHLHVVRNRDPNTGEELILMDGDDGIRWLAVTDRRYSWPATWFISAEPEGWVLDDVDGDITSIYDTLDAALRAIHPLIPTSGTL